MIACNTASAAALHGLRREFPEVPFVGMEPAVKPAAEHTRTGHVGVIATAATFQGELFASLLDRYAGHVAVHTQICPALVPLVESGELDSPRARRAVQAYLAPLLAAGIDQLVLGCTHYPFLRPLIEDVAGPGVTVIDPAPAVARQTGRVLSQRGWLGNADQVGRRSSNARHDLSIASLRPAIRPAFELPCTACWACTSMCAVLPGMLDGTLCREGCDNPSFIPSDLGYRPGELVSPSPFDNPKISQTELGYLLG